MRIETLDAADNPLGVGTSFVLAHSFAGQAPTLFLISNRHVIEGGSTGFIYFTSKDSNGLPEVGKPFFIRVDGFDMQWHGHPNPDVDIAIFPLGWQLDLIRRGGKEAYLMELSTTMLASVTEIAESDAFMPVLFVGYPNGIFDTVNYTPIVRQGTLATPLEFDFDGRPTFLIDASVFPGSSGSPVYSYKLSIEGRIVDIRLLGVLSAVFTRQESGEIELIPAPTTVRPIVSFRQLLDLGVVMKAHLISETLADFASVHGLSPVQ